MTQPLKPGDRAPAFQLPTSKGGPASLSDYAGKYLILFFYPKDDTDACTREAVAFSEARPKLARKGPDRSKARATPCFGSRSSEQR